MQIKGKTVIITGGGRGIGREMAKSFAERGANLALFDLNQADLDETARLCAAHGVQARGYLVNVTQEATVSAGMDAVAADFGGIDVLINNAGIVKDGLLIKSKDGAVTGKMTLDQWQAVIDINLTGVFLCGREAAERMVKRGQGGVIINISSVSRHGNPGQTNYSATKAGVATSSLQCVRRFSTNSRPRCRCVVSVKRAKSPTRQFSSSRTTSSRAAASMSTAA